MTYDGSMRSHVEIARLDDKLRLRERVIVLSGPITEQLGREVIAKLLFLANDHPELPIALYVDSPGGQVSIAFAIRDAIDDIEVPVTTHCLSNASGAALLLLAHGTKGERTCAAAGMVRLVAVEDRDRAETTRVNRMIAEALANDCEHALDAVLRDMHASTELTSSAALRYRLIDRIED
jgi:ATP-dependent Clp protease, protease subunit